MNPIDTKTPDKKNNLEVSHPILKSFHFLSIVIIRIWSNIPVVNEKANPLTGVLELLSANFVITVDIPIRIVPATTHNMYFK